MTVPAWPPAPLRRIAQPALPALIMG